MQPQENWIPSHGYYKSVLREDQSDIKETATQRYFSLIFEKLLKHNQCEHNRKPVLLIGTGFSIESGLPNWQCLMKKLFFDYSDFVNRQEGKYLKERSIINDLDKILNINGTAEHLIDFAEYLKLQYTRFPKGIKRFENALRNILIKNKRNRKIYSPNNNHKLLVKMFPYISGIITTNYDTLIEDALISENSKQPKYDFDIKKNVYKFYEGKKLENDLKKNQEHKFIIKIHGCINDSDLINNLILGRKDYSILSIDHSLIFQIISKLYRDKDHRLIILGYSLNDRDILSLLSYMVDLKGPVKNVFVTGLSLKDIYKPIDNNKEYKWMNVNLYNMFMLPYPMTMCYKNKHKNLPVVLKVLLKQLKGANNFI